MKGEVHIIAKGKGWDSAPDKGETWGVNDIILRRDQLSICFHMHNMEWIKGKEEKALELIINKANKNNVPVMTHKKLKWIPTSIAYPLDEVVEKYKANYFGSSIDYMLVYAMYKGFEKINLYGVNMVLKNEYDFQKPSLEFWIGMAMGQGHKIKIFDGKYGAILKTHDQKLYGYNLPMFRVE